jgi:diadenosine tetraphosphatase ApaH/serine/threonine PP2A family protein phosphatase
LAAVIDSRIFCARGGLNASVFYVDQILVFDRKREIEIATSEWATANVSELESPAMVDLT